MQSRIRQLMIILLASINVFGITITDDIQDEGQMCFKIKTESATYFYQKAAGGFTSILDRDGTDWVDFHPVEEETYPACAASAYRGLPNMVFRGDDGGAGHPGFEKCVSIQVGVNTIRSFSKSGKWQWSWTFTETTAILTVEKVDPEQAYWFLYEGPVAGRYAPDKQYWGTDTGMREERPDHYKGGEVAEHWQWAYFGDKQLDRIFFVAQQEKDEYVDHFSYLGNEKTGIDSPDGMVVFGFGRDTGATPVMKQQRQRFVVGFLEMGAENDADYERVREKIKKLLE